MNPFEKIKKGIKGISNNGSDFLRNVRSGTQEVGDRLSKLRSNVSGGLDVTRDATLKQFDKSYLGYASDKANKGVRTARNVIGDFVENSESGRELRARGRDETAKGTLSVAGSGLTGTSRIANKLDEFSDSRLGKISQYVPGFGGAKQVDRISELITGKGIFEQAKEISEKGADDFYQAASFIDEYDAETVALEDVQKDPSKASAYWVQTLGQGIPSVAATTLGAITTGGTGAFVVGGLMEGGGQYTEAKSMGATDDEADIAGLVNGLTSGFLEALGTRGILKNTPIASKVTSRLTGGVMAELATRAGKSSITKMIRSSISEGGTEAAQQLVSNAIAKVIYDKDRNIFEGVKEAGVGGFVVGQAISGTGIAANKSIDIAQKAAKSYKNTPNKQGGFVNVNNKREQEEEVIEGSEIAKEVQDMGSDQGGISDFSAQEIASENYTRTEVPIQEIIDNDPDLKEYLDNTPEIRDFEGEPFAMDPIISSKGEVRDGYNRIAQALQDGRTTLPVLKGIEKDYVQSLRNRARNASNEDDFVNSQMNIHRPPEKSGSNTLDNLADIYPKDLYSDKGLQYYGFQRNNADKESYDVIRRMKGNPEAEVTVYRAVESGEDANINPGSWVTTSKEYAKMHGESTLKPGYRIIEKKVKAKELTTDGDDLNEWGYRPEGNRDMTKDELRNLFRESREEKFQTPESPRYYGLLDQKKDLQKTWENAKTQQERNRVEKAIQAIDRKLAKFQSPLKHELSRMGYIMTQEAYDMALKIPAFRELSKLGRVQLRKMMNNPDALGSFMSGVISYVKNPHSTTLPHETFHAVMDMAFNTKERSEALDLAREESGMTDMNNRDAEEWIAQNFANWYVDRSNRTFSDRLKELFQKLKNFFLRIELDTPKLESLFRKVISEETAQKITKYQDVGAIKETRKEFNQDPELFTTQLFQDTQLWSKPTQKRETVEAAINRLKKPVMKDYALAKLETEFDMDDVINMADFRESLERDLIKFSIIDDSRGTAYPSYGFRDINRTSSEIQTATTHIINTDFDHGKTGHFGDLFNEFVNASELGIKQHEGKFYVLKETDVNRDNPEQNFFGAFDSQEQAQEYIDNFDNRNTYQKGMFAHFRSFMSEDKKIFNIAEAQSDVFQKDISSLPKSNEDLKKSKINAEKSNFNEIKNPILELIKTFEENIKSLNKAEELIKEFENKNYSSKEELKEAQTQLSFRFLDELREATYISYKDEKLYRNAIQEADVTKLKGKNKLNYEDLIIKSQKESPTINTLTEIREHLERAISEKKEKLSKETKDYEKKIENIESMYKERGAYYKRKRKDLLGLRKEEIERLLSDKERYSERINNVKKGDNNIMTKELFYYIRDLFKGTDKKYSYPRQGEIMQFNIAPKNKRESDMNPGIEALVSGGTLRQEDKDFVFKEFEKIKEMIPNRLKELEKELANTERDLNDIENNFELLPEEISELEKSKQFLSFKNKNEEKIIDFAIRKAASSGAEKVRFPTPMTVSYVEGYVTDNRDNGESSYTMDELYEGKVIEQLGIEGYASNITEEGYDFVHTEDGSDSITMVDINEFTDGQVESFRDDFADMADEAEFRVKLGLKYDYDVEIEERIDEKSIKELLENKEFSEMAEKVKEEMVEEYEDALDVDEITGYISHRSGDTLYISYESDVFTESLGYMEQVNKDDFSLDSLPNETHQKIAAKYGKDDNGKKGVFYKYLEKKRKDLREVEDEQGFTWWETDIAPGDRAAVELFQTKDQIQKYQEQIDEIEQKQALEELEISFKEEGLSYNPARELAKFQNKNKELPEVTGKGGIFATRGDNIVTELGFQDTEEARQSFEEYVEQNEEFKAMKAEYAKNKRNRLSHLRNIKERVKRLEQGKRLGKIEERREIKRNQDSLVRLIKKSNLSLKDQGKFISTVKNVQTVKHLNKAIPIIQDRIERLNVQDNARTLKSKIEKTLKKTKVKKQNGKPVGKFSPEVQDVFDKMRKAIKLTQAKASERIAEILSTTGADQMITEDQALEIEVLEMSAGLDNANPEKLMSTWKNIQSLMEQGRALNELQSFNRKVDINRKTEHTLDIVRGDKDYLGTTKQGLARKKKGFWKNLKNQLKTLGDYVALDWDGLMTTLDWNSNVENKTLQKLFSVNKEETQYKQLTEEYLNDLKFNLAEIYGHKANDRQTAKKLKELTQDEIDYGTFVNGRGENFNLVLTRDQAIKKYMEFKDPDILETYMKADMTQDGRFQGNAYTQEMIDAINDSLTDQDIAYAEFQLDMYREQYQKVNNVYRKLYSVNLPQNENYSPIRRTDYKVDTESGFGEFLDQVTQSTVNKGFLKSRVKNHNPIEDMGASEVLYRHMAETSYFVSWAEKARELKAIFGNQELSRSIENEFNKGFRNRINESIDMFINNGKGGKHVFAPIDFVRSNLTTSTLMLKPAIFVKQLTSTIAILEKIPAKDFVTGFSSYFKNFQRANRLLNEESTVIRNRGSNMDRDIKDAMQSEEYQTFSERKNLVNHMMMNVKLGDKGAIMPAAWAYRQYLLKQGKSKAEAVAEYEQFISSTQQSSDLSKLALVQKGGSFVKLLTMYMTSPRQYYQKELLAVKSLFQEGGTKPENLKRVSKTLFVYHVLLPFVFQFVSNAGRLDDEAWKDYKRAMMLGSINGVLIVGEFADQILRGIMGQMVFESNVPINEIMFDLAQELSAIDFSDFSAEDVIDIIKASEPIGEALTGLGIDPLKNLVEGTIDIKNGAVKEGIGNIAGWSDYSQTGKGKRDRLTPAEKKVRSRYEKLKEADMNDDDQMFNEIRNSLSDSEWEAVKMLKKREEKEEMDNLKKELEDTYDDLREADKADDTKTFNEIKNVLTDKEWEAIKQLKKDEERKDKNKEVSQLALSIEGLFVDPKQVLTGVFTSEEIEKIEGNLVKFKRKEWQGEGGTYDMKSEMMEEIGLNPETDRSRYELDHIVPLTAGGSNSRENLQLLSIADHKKFTQVDIALGKSVMSRKMRRREAAQIARALKNGEISTREAMDLIKQYNES